ncbi:MAG: FKBP-type peptidyl-prolyl cis-trans isomerase [Cytophagaceae bacterium]|jgi:FKBP-type peptidyl-prolyl cis-trans isomerase|nr:FKBP-type peptidyl-prolyl cis-trans isomerase [Cytophagaceae bacterium]
MIIRTLFLLAALSLGAQNWKTTKTGLKYRIFKDVKGKPAKYGDDVKLYFDFLNYKDSLLSSNQGKDLLEMKIEKTFTGSLEEGLTLMSVGDSMIFQVPSDSLGFPERPPFIPEGTPVFFRIKLVELVRAPAQAKKVKPAKPHKKFKKLPSGLEYWFLKDDKTTSLIQRGGMVAVILKYDNEVDHFDSDESNQGQPIQLLIPDTLPNYSFFEPLLLASKGDSLLVRMASDSLYKNVFKQPSPGGLSKESKTLFKIQVKEVIGRDSVAVLKRLYEERKQLEVQQESMQLGQDTMQIVNYLKSNNLLAKRTVDGIYYYIRKSTEGARLQEGDSVQTYYAGRLLDGTEFDSNFNQRTGEYKQAFPVIVGVSPVIAGWHLALLELKRGEKATFFIPSSLGYGPDGAGEAIPPNAVLIFDIEVAE